MMHALFFVICLSAGLVLHSQSMQDYSYTLTLMIHAFLGSSFTSAKNKQVDIHLTLCAVFMISDQQVVNI